MMRSFIILASLACANAALRTAPKTVVAPTAPKVLASSSAVHATNATARTLTTMELGPFPDLAGACEYCYGSHTKTSVVANCRCAGYMASDGPTMFCTASQAGIAYVSAKDGACMCNPK